MKVQLKILKNKKKWKNKWGGIAPFLII